MGAVYIVEGVAGSGKDTLVGQIVDALRPFERRVLAFPEEAVLATWLYYFVPGIHEIRLDLTQRLVEYVKVVLARDSEVAFVFNRFHVSHAVWREELGAGKSLEERHHRLVAGLKELPVRIFQTLLEEQDAEQRSRHIERRELAWQRFLEERVEFGGKGSAGGTFFEQQSRMTRVLEADGLAYAQVKVQAGTPLDIDKLLRGA